MRILRKLPYRVGRSDNAKPAARNADSRFVLAKEVCPYLLS